MIAMIEMLEYIANKVESAEQTAHCFIDKWNCQVIVSFDKRADTKIALLTPMLQKDVRAGKIDNNDLIDMVLSVRRIANFALKEA